MTGLRWTTLLLCALVVGAHATERNVTVGEVESVQSVDASQLGAGDYRVLVLTDGRGFRLPGPRRIAVGQGVRVEIEFIPLPEGSAGEAMPEACTVRVLAVPLDDRMQEAARPFAVYHNDSDDSGC